MQPGALLLATIVVAFTVAPITSVDGQSTCTGTAQSTCYYPCQWYNGACATGCSYQYSNATCSALPHCLWLNSACGYKCSLISSQDSCDSATGCQWTGGSCKTACSRYPTASCDTSYCIGLTGGCLSDCAAVTTTACGVNAYSSCVIDGATCNFRCNNYYSSSCPTAGGRCQIIGGSCYNLCNTSSTSTSCSLYSTSCTWGPTGCHLTCSRLSSTTCTQAPFGTACEFASGASACIETCSLISSSPNCAATTNCRWNGTSCTKKCSAVTTSPSTACAAQTSGTCSTQLGYCRAVCSMASDATTCAQPFFSADCQWNGTMCVTACSAVSGTCPSYCVTTGYSACTPNCPMTSAALCGSNSFSSCSSAVFSDTTPAVACTYRCNSFTSSACPTSNGYCQLAGTTCLDNCSRIVSGASDCGKFTTCRWYTTQGCQVSCSSLTQTTCSNFNHCAYLGGYCVMKCDMFTNPTDCAYWYECTWLGSSCRRGCTQFGSSADCTTVAGSYCTREPSSTACIPICSVAPTADICVNAAFSSYCAWKNGTCSRRCNGFNTTYCATQPQCQVVGSSCMANCAYAAANDYTSGLPQAARCGQYPEYSSCVWASNVCVDSCSSYYGSTSCMQVSACQYVGSTCVNKCDQFGQAACSTLSSSCIWANNKCQTRCQVLNSTMCAATDYCNWDTTSNQCVTSCGALDRTACDAEYTGRCGWLFGTCRTRCSFYTINNCASDYCVVAGTNCRSKCTLAQNSTACSLNNIMTSDCGWFPQFNLCLTSCTLFNSTTCPSSYCSPATGAYTTGCIPNCAIAYDPSSPTDGAQRCGWSNYYNCKWFDGQCIAQCNNAYFGCSSTSCTTVNSVCMNTCSSAPSRQWCTGGYSSCTWIAATSSCKPKCIGLVASSCPSDYCSNSSGFCLPQCNLLLTQQDCGIEDASCLWVNDQCISHCQTYTAAGCTPSHCEVVNGACKVRCSFATTASACAWGGWSSNCLWLNNTCTIRCNNFGTNGYCPQPYCMWSGSTCIQDCAYGTRYNYNTNMGFQCSGNCRMYSNLTTCTTQCNSYSVNNCPLKRCMISSLSGNCINPCNMAVTALECGLMGADNGGTCQWVPSQNLCRERCSSISKTLCPLDYCTTTSYSCATRCDLFNATRTTCLSIGGCAYTNGVCHTSCYSQPSTNCDSNYCVVNGTNCLPRCEYQADPTSCEQNTMSYCAWRSGQCRLNCYYQQVQYCDTSYCIATGSSCRPQCTGGQDPNGNAPVYDKCLWGTYGACQWNSGECVARCTDFGSSCPAYPTCMPLNNVGESYTRCLDPCNTTTNATRCTDVFTSCTWANGQCLPACTQFSSQGSCAGASHCYWRNQVSNVPSGCYPVCSLLTTSNGCNKASINNYYAGSPSCIWSGTQCLTDCASYDTASCPSSYCDVSGSSCIFRCSLFSTSTYCNNKFSNVGAGMSCAWVGDSCKTLCSLYTNTSCPTHCATSYSGNCLFQCSLASLTYTYGDNAGSRTYCGGSELFGHCFVSYPGGTGTCTPRCYQNYYYGSSNGCLSTPSANCELIAGQCFDKCSSITSGDVCAQLSDCNWVAGACSRKCTTLPATACAANPLCEADPLGNCAPKCSALTNALDCGNVGTYSQYCRWGSNGVCTKGCTQYTYGTCPTGSTSQCRRTTAGTQCLYKCSFWTDSSNCSQSTGCTWSSSTGVCVDNCIYSDAPNCPSNCYQLSGTCNPGTCAAYGSSSCYADQLPCANISGTCTTRCTGSAYTECSLSTCVLNPDSWVGPQCVDQCPSSLSQADCGNRLGCMYDGGSCKINCLFASLSTCATLSHCQVVSPRCYPQCSALSSAAACGQYPSICTWSGSSCITFVTAAPTTRAPPTPASTTSVVTTTQTASPGSVTTTTTTTTAANTPLPPGQTMAPPTPTPPTTTSVPPTPLPPGQTFAPTTATPPTQSTQQQSTSTQATSTQAQQTPAPATFVTLSLTLGGNYVPLMTTSNRPALESALRTDLARSFGVPYYRIAILSLTLGSLNVAFTVTDVSVASAQATMSTLTSQPTTTTFPDLSTMYAANNAGATTTVNSVAITGASAPYGPAASAESSSSAVGIGIGVTVAVLVVIGIIVAAIFISRKSSSAAAPARQEQQQPFLTTVPASQSYPPAQRVNPVTGARDQEMYRVNGVEL